MSEGHIGRSVLSWLLLACACAISLAAVVSLWDIYRQSPVIHFILPPGFRGGFITVEDASGVDLGGRFTSRYVVAVPVSRVVKVKSTAPFSRWHSETVQVGDDRVSAWPSKDDETGLRALGFATRNGSAARTIYFLGTKSEADAFDPFALSADDTPDNRRSN